MSTVGRVGAAGVVAALVLSACGDATSVDRGQPALSAPASSAPAMSTSAPAQPATPARSPATQPTAAEQLTGFFKAVARIDAQLRSAAVLVNGEVDADGAAFSAATLAAIEAIEPAEVVREVPGGLPPELLRRVLLVYSDLVARRLALRGVEHAGPAPDAGLLGWVLECLASGGVAADRFAQDLADARAAAASVPAVPSAAPDSRAAAEVAIRAEAILSGAGACGSCFGTAQTTLAPLVWEGSGTDWHGTVGGVPFRASYAVGTGWVVSGEWC